MSVDDNAFQGDGAAVTLERVSKTYGQTRVLEIEQLILPFGTVTGLVGENGAGKSTLLGTLAGTVTPDPGSTITIDGVEIEPGSPAASQTAGIAMVSQEFPLVNQLNVIENLLLGQRPEGGTRVLYDFKAAARAAQRMLEEVKLDIDPRALVANLSVPARQMLEVAKAVGRKPRLLILDEPTSALGPIEADQVIAVARKHAADGGAVLFVGHRLEEVRQAADRVIVMRNGHLVADFGVAEASDERLIREMVGRENLGEIVADRAGIPNAKQVFVAEDLTADRLGPVGLAVGEGEVLGVAGLMGSGRSRLLHTIFGAIRSSGGTMTLAGAPYRPNSPGDAVRQRIALVPEDRKQQSILADAPVRWNVTLATLRKLGRYGTLSPRHERSRARDLVDRARVRLASIEQPIRSLSGGNQQQVVFGRWFAVGPKLLLLDEPTRGVDVGAKAEIYHLIDEARPRDGRHRRFL